MRSHYLPNFTEPQTSSAQGIVQNDRDHLAWTHSLAPPTSLFERAMQKFTYLHIQLVPVLYSKSTSNRFNRIDFFKQQQAIQTIFTGAEQIYVPHWNILRALGSLPKICRFKMI